MSLRDHLRPGAWLAAAWRRHPLLAIAIVAVPVLLLISVVGPVLGITHELSRLVVLTLRPLLQGPGGRFVLLNLIALAVGLLLWWRGRGRVRALIGSWALQRFLAGLGRLAVRDFAAAERHFRAVLRAARLVDLSRAVPVLKELLPEARLKLALALVGQGHPARALREVELVAATPLSGRLQRTVAELRAMLYLHEGGFLPETVSAELERALAADAANPRLLRVLRDRRRGAGDRAGALELQERLLRALGPGASAAERGLLAFLSWEEAREAKGRGERKKARALLKGGLASVPDFAPARLLLGDLDLEAGDVGGALSEWGKAGGLEALARVERAMGPEGDLKEAARRFPYPSLLLIAARRYRATGELRRARRALELAEGRGFQDPVLYRLWGEIWEEEGKPEEARRCYVKALAQAARG